MDSQSGEQRHPSRAESHGPAARRSINTVRKEFIAMAEPTLRALDIVDRLCAELLEAIEREPLSQLYFGDEPETRPDNGTIKRKR